jgi:hypothetical protein
MAIADDIAIDVSGNFYYTGAAHGAAGDAEGIKTFETTGTLGSAGGSTTVIRTSDI